MLRRVMHPGGTRLYWQWTCPPSLGGYRIPMGMTTRGGVFRLVETATATMCLAYRRNRQGD